MPQGWDDTGQGRHRCARRLQKKQLEPRLDEAKAGQRVVFFVDAAHFVLGDAQKLSLHVWVPRRNLVVPFWMESVASYVEARHFRGGDLYAFGIGVGIEFAADRNTFFVVVWAISAIAT